MKSVASLSLFRPAVVMFFEAFVVGPTIEMIATVEPFATKDYLRYLVLKKSIEVAMTLQYAG